MAEVEVTEEDTEVRTKRKSAVATPEGERRRIKNVGGMWSE